MTLVFLHPVGLDHNFWKFTGLEGAMPDYPGHGDRPLPEPEELFTLEYIADDVVKSHGDVLDLVGVSMGGIVSAYVALRHPQRVRSIMMCCYSGRGTVGSPENQAREDRARDTIKLGMAGTLDSTLKRWFTQGALSETSHPGVAYARNRLLDDDARSVAATWRILAQSNLRDEIPKIQVPVTVLGGRHDQAATIARVSELFTLLPSARLEIIDGPHMLPLERPREFAGALRRHLDWVTDSV